MLQISLEDLERILTDFGICAKALAFSELQRDDYAQNGPDSKEVRLIVRVDLDQSPPLVVRLKHERDVTIDLIESQCRFAQTLRDHGVPTPRQYRAESGFVRRCELNGYDVLATVEEFACGELRVVDESTAEQTGALLAKMHVLSESLDLHVNHRVLFDPTDRNELFDFEAFLSVQDALEGDDCARFDRIVRSYRTAMALLSPLKSAARFAVQGDVSDCNLYRTASGEIGVFDFNQSGDNTLFGDAVMQAVFVARLMAYPETVGDDFESIVLSAFLRGYQSVRPFSADEQAMLPVLLAVIRAFGSADIRWNEDSLVAVCQKGDVLSVRRWLIAIEDRLKDLPYAELPALAHNKLVRDRIPEICRANGNLPRVRILSDEEFRRCLAAKLDEEVAEFHEDPCAEELSDILKVVYALAETIGYSEEALNALRWKKRAERGGFSEKIFLISTEESKEETP